MKIAQVVCTFPPYRGGIGNVAYYLTDNLAKLGHEVTVFTPRYFAGDMDVYSYFKVKKLKPQFKYGNAAIVWQLACSLKKFDIIHLHYPFIGAAFPILFAKLLCAHKVKLILHYHMDLVGNRFKGAIFSFYNWCYLKKLVKLADVVLVNSVDYLKASEIFPLYLRHPKKFRLLPNGVDVEAFQPLPKDQASVFKYKLQNKKVILFVGALDSAHYFKGVNYLLKAFQELKNRENAVLFVVGEGNLRSTYQDMADSFGLSDKVVFTGYLPDAELVKYYNLCDIFVLPSIDKSEAFGMVLIEAMACGKPVIATDLAGVREVVDLKINGRLVKPKDVVKLAEQMEVLLADEELCKKYGEAGRAKVERKYAWATITNKLEEIYQNKNHDEILLVK